MTANTVNMLEAKTHLSRLVEAIEQGAKREVIISRHGRPVARLVPIDRPPPSQRIGLAKGRFTVPDDFDALDEEIASLFLQSGSK
jgi:prevent-host-death family protein